MKRLSSFFALCLGLALTACTTYDCCDQSVIKAVPDALTFEWNETGAPRSINLTCPVPWQLEGATPSWLSVDLTSGSGNAVLSVELLSQNTLLTPLTHTLSFLAANGDRATCKVTVLGYKTYTIAITTPIVAKGATHYFAGATQGFYSSLMPTSFTITSTGTGAVTGLSVSISGTDFILDGTGLNSTLPPSGTTSFTIKPKDGLVAAVTPYTATVTINGTNLGSPYTFTVSFEVGTIYGDYEGKATATGTMLPASGVEVNPVKVALAPEAVDHSLEVASMTFGSITLPSFKVDGIVVTPSGSDYALSAAAPLNINIGPINVTITLESGSKIVGNLMTLNLKVAGIIASIPVTINIIFEGTLP